MRKHILFMTTSVGLLLLLFAGVISAEKVKRHVLYLNSYQNGYSWSDRILDGIRDTFRDSEFDVDLQVEYLDAKKFPGPEVQAGVLELMRTKYRDTRFDAVIVSDNDAYAFAISNRDKLFPAVPLVFCGVNDLQHDEIAGLKDVTGVSESLDAADTIDAALKLLPKTKTLVAIGDRSTTARAIAQQIRDVEPGFKGRLRFEFWEVSAMPELLARVRVIPRDAIVFLIPFYMEQKGYTHTPEDVGDGIAEVSRVPIISGWEFLLNHGILGGRLLSGHEQGRVAAGMVLRLFKGESAASIPVVEQTDDKFIFDYEVLTRLGIDPRDLPPGSRLINEPQPFYELEKPVFWTIMASLALLMVILFFLVMNIIKRKRVERKVKDQLSFMQLLMDTIPTPIYFRDASGRYREFNTSFAQWFGMSADSAAGGVDHLAALGQQVDDELMQRPGVRVYEDEVLDIDGRRHNVILHKASYRNAAGEAAGVVGVLYDFTDRKRAEEELRRAEEKYREIFENSALGIFRIAPDGRYLDANRAFARMLGLDDAVTLLASGPNILAATMQDGEFEARVRQGGEDTAFELETRHRRPDGNWVDLHVYVRAIVGEGGRTRYYEGVVEDVTVRRRTEQELIESKNMLRTVLDNIPQLVYWKDSDLRYMGANKSFADFFGLPDLDGIIGSTNREIMPVEQQALRGERVDRDILAGGDPLYRLVWEMVDRTGANVTLEISKVPLHDHAGNIVGVLSTAEDVTRKLSLEKQLLQSQKMEAIGTFVSGIAHDFNNILTTIINSAELALLDLDESSESAVDIQRALLAAEQGSHLVSQIHTYSRPTREGVLPTDVAAVVREAVSLLRATLPGNIRLEEHIDGSLGTSLVDPTQIHQIVMNLCSNAFQAMRDVGGLLIVSLMREHVEEPMADLLSVAPGEYLKLSVTDTGPGIPPDIADKIFDPFFTTKGKGEGTGLGLAVVQGIVKGHKGAIALSSAPFEQTVFDIYLPYMREEATAIAEETETVLTGNERVLFVEDNPDQVRTIPRVLARYGYEVVACQGAEAALDEIARSVRPFDVLVTDYDMPEISGVELARTIGQILPALPVIVVSGRKSAAEAAGSVPGIRQVLKKPYSGQALSAAIRKIFDTVG